MGNRAVVKGPQGATGVYLHWNGGLASVAGICKAAKDLGYRDPAADPTYGLARFAFLAGVLMCEAGLSLGVGHAEDELDNEPDNGIYTVGAGWKIVKRTGRGRGENAKRSPAGEDAEYANKPAKELVARVNTLREFAAKQEVGQ